MLHLCISENTLNMSACLQNSVLMKPRSSLPKVSRKYGIEMEMAEAKTEVTHFCATLGLAQPDEVFSAIAGAKAEFDYADWDAFLRKGEEATPKRDPAELQWQATVKAGIALHTNFNLAYQPQNMNLAEMDAMALYAWLLFDPEKGGQGVVGGG